MIKWIVAVVAALYMSTGVQASECIPFPAIKGALISQNVPTITSSDLEFIKSYLAALGLPLPQDSDPIGILFGVTPKVTIAAIIERENCVKYMVRIPTFRHEQALSGV